MNYHAVLSIGDLEDNGVVGVMVGDKELAIYKLSGEYFATDGVCTHAYASLAEGYVEDGQIECVLHGARFDIRTGVALCAPADRSLATYPVKVEGNLIYVGIPN